MSLVITDRKREKLQLKAFLENSYSSTIKLSVHTKLEIENSISATAKREKGNWTYELYLCSWAARETNYSRTQHLWNYSQKESWRAINTVSLQLGSQPRNAVSLQTAAALRRGGFGGFRPHPIHTFFLRWNRWHKSFHSDSSKTKFNS